MSERSLPGDRRPQASGVELPPVPAHEAKRIERHLRQRSRYVHELLHRRENRLLAWGVVFLIVGVILWLGLELSAPPADTGPQCHLGPHPGVNWSNCDLEALDLGRADLAGASLRNARLRGSKLIGARLTEADLAYAELSETDLGYADLRRANLLGANLERAHLAYADLREANLAYADLARAVLGGARLEGAQLDHAIWLDGRVCAAGSVGKCRAP